MDSNNHKQQQSNSKNLKIDLNNLKLTSTTLKIDLYTFELTSTHLNWPQQY